MSKKIFRFLRGELNGFYLANLYNILNKGEMQILTDFLCTLKKKQFLPITQYSNGMTREEISNLGRFCGVYAPLADFEGAGNSIKFLDYELGNVFNETGVTQMSFKPGVEVQNNDARNAGIENTGYIYDNEENKWYKHNPDNASKLDPADEAVVKGKRYSTAFAKDFPYEEGEAVEVDGVVVKDTDGNDVKYNVDNSKDKRFKAIAQGEYIFNEYGDIVDSGLKKWGETTTADIVYPYDPKGQFMFLGDAIKVLMSVDANALWRLICAMQTIRYNGTSLQSLLDVIDILCTNNTDEQEPDINDPDIEEWNNNYRFFLINGIEYGEHGVVVVKYTLNNNSIVDNKDMRFSALQSIVRYKFPTMILMPNNVNGNELQAKMTRR